MGYLDSDMASIGYKNTSYIYTKRIKTKKYCKLNYSIKRKAETNLDAQQT